MGNDTNLTISTSACGPLEPLPAKYSKDADNVSPELTWSGIPENAQELAVIMHDPDAPMPDGFTHWVVYGIPASARGIPEGGGQAFTEGVNDFGDSGYGGPQPPPDHGVHHYYFWVYALDAPLNAPTGLSRRELLDAMDGHIIEQNRCIATYEL